MTAGLLQLQEQALITRKVRCLHVGNVTGSVTAEIMRAFINGAMHKENMAAAPGDVVIRIDPLPEKCACFLEFRSPIECSNALGLSGIELQGRQLRISRTRDYEPCPPHLLNVVIPPGLPPPGTAMQKAIASRNAGVSAGYGARPDLAGSTVKQDGMTFDGFAWTKSGQPRMRDSRPAEERPSTALELSRGARRVYVGNLPPTELLDNEALKGFFTRSMTERSLHDLSKVAGYPPFTHAAYRRRTACAPLAGWLHAGWLHTTHRIPAPTAHRSSLAPLTSPQVGPGISPMIIGVHRDASGKWAFLEFRTVAEATSCMNLTGIVMGSNPHPYHHFHPQPNSNLQPSPSPFTSPLTLTLDPHPRPSPGVMMGSTSLVVNRTKDYTPI